MPSLSQIKYDIIMTLLGGIIGGLISSILGNAIYDAILNFISYWDDASLLNKFGDFLTLSGLLILVYWGGMYFPVALQNPQNPVQVAIGKFGQNAIMWNFFWGIVLFYVGRDFHHNKNGVDEYLN
ncbi:hypothetical protein [Halorussus sp. MSC15.2]|uniref:hypothetical protein n=1 Tax=Halorussus sp. MSC15.2 TaxID=2283638 RepID=UPI0013D211F3|nr:hypothetical protein [Halorussus sp. MSC15.2]NEU57246.1 hypothetical protein [Halorussus sp. MSC15.2]